MAHLYEVQTSQGTFNVTSNRHHDHMSQADFEKMLVQTILSTVSGVAQGLILHRYAYRGHR